MPTRTKITLVLLLMLVVGCTGTPHPAPAAPPATQAAEQRRTKYDELGDHLAGIPYVIGWGLDSRQDKLTVDVGTLEAEQAVQQVVMNLGLPADSVIIEHPKQMLTEAAPFEGCQTATPPNEGGAGGLSLLPAEMRPGQPFRLSVNIDARDAAIMRGVDSYLECWTGKDWSTRYMLQVALGSPDAKPTARIYPGGAVVTLGLIGKGPEDLVLPPNIPPGWYRIRKQVSVENTQQTLTALFQVR